MSGQGSPAAASSFVSMLEPDDRAALLRAGRSRRYPPGASIAIQGDHSEAVFVVCDGWVKVTAATADGHEIVLALLGPGDLFGEFEAIDHDGGPRDAGVAALDAVECRVVSADDFRDFIGSRPDAALVLLRAVIRRLRAADRRRVDSGSLDVGHRLARFLLELAEAHGHPTSAGIDIDLAVTQQELASLISASRESVVRAFTQLRAHGLIATARRRLTIRDPDGLRRYAA